MVRHPTSTITLFTLATSPSANTISKDAQPSDEVIMMIIAAKGSDHNDADEVMEKMIDERGDRWIKKSRGVGGGSREAHLDPKWPRSTTSHPPPTLTMLSLMLLRHSVATLLHNIVR